MSRSFSPHQITALEAVLSTPRFAKYLAATGGDRHRAMQLYCWNAEISAAFFLTLQFCELAVRNGAVEALEIEFGTSWHTNRGFYNTLPILRGGKGYQPREDVKQLGTRLATPGKVVAELKFAFWQYLFVKGQDARLWAPHFSNSFPGYDKTLSVKTARAVMHKDIEHIRRLRNRIAHHEPIFYRNLADDFAKVRKLIEWRSPEAALWLDSVENVTQLIAHKP